MQVCAPSLSLSQQHFMTKRYAVDRANGVPSADLLHPERPTRSIQIARRILRKKLGATRIEQRAPGNISGDCFGKHLRCEGGGGFIKPPLRGTNKPAGKQYAGQIYRLLGRKVARHPDRNGHTELALADLAHLRAIFRRSIMSTRANIALECALHFVGPSSGPSSKEQDCATPWRHQWHERQQPGHIRRVTVEPGKVPLRFFIRIERPEIRSTSCKGEGKSGPLAGGLHENYGSAIRGSSRNHVRGNRRGGVLGHE